MPNEEDKFYHINIIPMEKIRKTGLDIIGNVPWGTHLCQFYNTGADLLDILLPYFKAGLENNEYCMWVASEPLTVEEVNAKIDQAAPDLREYINKGQLEIIPHTAWYLKDGYFSQERILNGWIDRLNAALKKGYEGLRLTGNTFWLEKDDWKAFTDYEEAVNNVIGNYKILAICTYSLDKCGAHEIIDVVQNHQFALIKRDDIWQRIESSEHRRVMDELDRLASFPRLNPNPVFEIDRSGEITFLNDAASKALIEAGLDKNGKGILIPSGMGEVFSALNSGQKKEFYREVHIKDRIFAETVYTAPEYNTVRVYAIDITDRKNIEESLYQNAKEWERTFDSVPDMIALLDTKHRIVRVNSAMAGQLGLKTEECIGLPCYKYVHGLDAPPSFCPHSQTMKDGCPHMFELNEERLGGDLLVSTTPIVNARGKITGSVHVARNVSILKRAEQKFRILSETSGDLLATDTPQKIVDRLCMKVMSYLDCQAFFNFLADENAGRLRLNAYAGIPVEAAKEIEWLDYGVAVCGCAARDGVRIVCENIPETPDPRTELVKSYGIKAYACHPLLAGGKVIGTLSFGTKTRTQFTDDEIALMKTVADQVSVAMERKRLEEERERLFSDLVRSNRELEQFAYISSHDLQEPLRMVSSYVQLLTHRYKGRLDKDADEFITYIVNGTFHMQSLLNDLLTYSRVGTRGEPFKLTDLKSAFNKALVNLKVEIDGSGAEITPGNLPIVHADEVQLVQVFQNLLSNAMKFRTGGAPRISVSAEMKDDQWMIRVSDNGIGIDPKYFDRIFLVFKRLHTKEKYPGTGMGLAICQKIIERHGGRIWVESRPGEGATFCFTLPGKREGQGSGGKGLRS